MALAVAIHNKTSFAQCFSKNNINIDNKFYELVRSHLFRRQIKLFKDYLQEKKYQIRNTFTCL